MSTSGASHHRGSSKQDYATPQDFRIAVARRFGIPSFDLAADAKNAFCKPDCGGYFDEKANSLTKNWRSLNCDLLWLNPPFGNIAPWARKCAVEFKRGATILFLVPASVGSNWYAEHVHGIARVYFLSPRLCFDGKNPFPKDILLAHYGHSIPGCDCWRWDKQETEKERTLL